MRALRTAGLWFLIIFGVYGLGVLICTLFQIQWPNDIVLMVVTIAAVTLLPVAFFLALNRSRRVLPVLATAAASSLAGCVKPIIATLNIHPIWLNPQRSHRRPPVTAGWMAPDRA